ncbi:hypothetical protein F5Y15DRAFT_378322 [Xylariaceae sp. FL0016]|nr:hypothetical protein F5Y15DRAFT_378322 [Xylariaceae sp. FL0016]
MSTKGTILITGLNGYLAGRTAELALKDGYRVRGTVRNLEAGDKVKTTLCDLGYRADDVEVVYVADVSQPGSLDEAAVGCIAILHLAAPFAEIWTLPPSEVVRLGVDSTLNMLKSASKAGPQMRSAVYMSSAAAVFNMPPEQKLHTEEDWNTTAEAILKEQGEEAGGFNAYLASKTLAERAFWNFRKEQEPQFGMTALQPTYFIGEPLVPWQSPEKIPYSNSGFWKVVNGEDIPGPMMIYEDTVDVRDVARVVLWSALNPDKADGERFICSSAVGNGQAIADIIGRASPSPTLQRGEPRQGYKPDYTPKDGCIGFDGSKTVRATGQDWIPYEKSVVDLTTFLKRYLK